MKYDYVNVRYTPVEDCADIITLIETDKRKLAALRRKADLLTGG